MKEENNNSGLTHSHYIPAEKPYAVYAFVWEGPNTTIAQLIGTILVGKTNEDGDVVFDNKPVYRIPEKDMLDFYHCFIPKDMGPIVNDELFIGFAGDTMHLEDITKIKLMDLIDSDGYYSPEVIIENMRRAGLKVELPERVDIEHLAVEIKTEYTDGGKSIDCYLEVTENAPLRVKFWNGKSNRSCRNINIMEQLGRQINDWNKVNVFLSGWTMADKDKQYQEQIDELWRMTLLYGKYIKSDDDCLIYRLLKARETLGTDRCFYDDLVAAMAKQYYTFSDDNLQWAVDNNILTREGSIYRFSGDFEKMANWQWKWLDGDERYKSI